MSKLRFLMGEGLRKIDRFGHPISLTYKNETTFKSSFGGTMTLLSILTLLAYFGVLLSQIIYSENYSITNSRFIRNLYLDDTAYDFDTSNFDLAFHLSYLGPDPSVQNIH